LDSDRLVGSKAWVHGRPLDRRPGCVSLTRGLGFEEGPDRSRADSCRDEADTVGVAKNKLPVLLDASDKLLYRSSLPLAANGARFSRIEQRRRPRRRDRSPPTVTHQFPRRQFRAATLSIWWITLARSCACSTNRGCRAESRPLVQEGIVFMLHRVPCNRRRPPSWPQRR